MHEVITRTNLFLKINIFSFIKILSHMILLDEVLTRLS